MTPEQFRLSEVLFARAIELPPGDRASYLDSACDGDADVRAHLDLLLEADDTEDAVLDQDLPAAPPPAPQLDQPPLPASIGPYQVLDELGRGGMGVVYRARQDEPARDVAVKVLRGGLATTRLVRRFRQEAAVLARLQHPGIAQVYEAGTDAGSPYFVMELIDGRALTDHADAHMLDVRARVTLLIRLCDALQHAHQRGVIHRDLKPGNILVAEDDDVGQPKVLDFGVARATGPDFHTTTVRTDVGQLVGTLAYMSPEQVSGDPDAIDIRTDIYGVGVLGFELLTGVLPIDVRGASLGDAVRRIEQAPAKTLGSVDRDLRGDLETILGKALHKDKTQRYPSASELGADLRRYLDDEPIVARPASALYQLRKFAQRNRSLMGSLAAIVLISTIAAVVTSILYVRSEFRAERLRRAGYAQSISIAQHAYEMGDGARLARELEACPPDLRGWEWHRLDYLADDSVLALRGHTGPIYALAFSPDGRRLASGAAYSSSVPADQRDTRAMIWDVETGECLHVLESHVTGINAAAFTTSGRFLATAGGADLRVDPRYDPDVRVWDPDTGELVHQVYINAARVSGMTPLPGERVAVSCADDTIRVVDVEKGEVVEAYEAPHRSQMAITAAPDGSWISTVSWNEHLITVDTATGEVTDVKVAPVRRPLMAIAALTDDRVVIAGREREVVVTDRTGERHAVGVGHDGQIEGVAATHDGVIISAAFDQTVRAWDATTGAQRRLFRGAGGPVFAVAAQPNGPLVAAGGGDGVVRVWRRGDQDRVDLTHGTFEVNAAIWIDDNVVATGVDDNAVHLWNADDGVEIARFDVGEMVYALDAHAETIAAGLANGQVVLVDRESGQMQHFDAGTEYIYTVALRPDRGDVTILALDGKIRRLDLSTGAILDAHDLPATAESATMTRDGSMFVVPCRDGHLRVFAIDTSEVVHDVEASAAPFLATAASPDGTMVAASDELGRVTVWTTADWSVIRTIDAYRMMSRGVGFSADSTRLVTSSYDGRVTLYDIASGDQLYSFRGHERHIYTVAFDPAGERLLTGSADGWARIWPTKR